MGIVSFGTRGGDFSQPPPTPTWVKGCDDCPAHQDEFMYCELDTEQRDSKWDNDNLSLVTPDWCPLRIGRIVVEMSVA